jgi:hypothetical protein
LKSKAYLLVLASLMVGSAQARESAGVTNMTYSGSHGTQVEYLSRSGDAFLWYPGNAVVVKGRWRGTVEGKYPAICFAYQANSYNPVTGSVGSQWECEPTLLYERNIVDRSRGDAFGLSTRTEVPFPLGPERTTLRALASQH